jgi:hypothetical protein
LRPFAKLLIVALPLAVGALVLRESVDIPFWDEWDWTDLVYAMQHGTLHFSQLWAQHNEHRILIPNLIMLGLARLGGWHPIREQFVSLAVLVCSQIIIVILMRRSAHGTAGWLAAAAGSLMLYELGQAENFLWGFQMAWFICDAAAIVVAWLLARPNRRWWHVLLAIIAATLATYSSAQGILAWAVGAVAIVLTGGGIRHFAPSRSLRTPAPDVIGEGGISTAPAFAVAAHANPVVAQHTSPPVILSGAKRSRRTAATLALWLLLAIVEYAIYQHGLIKVAVGHSNIATDSLGIVLYALTYLGAPALGGRGMILSAVAGLALIVALAWAFCADMQSAQRIRRLIRNAPWYALSVFPLLCAAGTAVGRGAFGLDQALEQRYVTVSVLGWVALIGLIAGTIAHLPRPHTARLRASLLALAAVFVFVIASDDDKGLKQMHQFSATLHAGLTDPTKLYPDPRRLKQLMAERRSL